MSKIHFHLSDKQVLGLTWEEYESLERARDGEVKLYLLRPLLARFMVDENGEALQHARAMQELAQLPVNRVTDVVDGFMQEIRNKAIPKASGNSPSPESSRADGFPDGAAR